MIPALLSTLVLALGADGPPEAPPEMPDPTRPSPLELAGAYDRAVAVYGPRWKLIRIAWLWIRCGRPVSQVLSDEAILHALGKPTETSEDWTHLAGLWGVARDRHPFLYILREGLTVECDQWNSAVQGNRFTLLAARPGCRMEDWPPLPPGMAGRGIASTVSVRGRERTSFWTPAVSLPPSSTLWIPVIGQGWVTDTSRATVEFSERGLLLQELKRWAPRQGVTLVSR